MAVAGSACNGYWLSVKNGRLHELWHTGTRDLLVPPEEAVAKLRAGGKAFIRARDLDAVREMWSNARTNSM